MTLLHPSPQVTREPHERPSAARRALTLGLAALSPLIAGYAAVAALLALVAALASNASFDTVGVLLVAGTGWLTAAHVPIEIGGHPLGVLPLLLTVFLVLLVRQGAAAAADRLGPGRPADALPIVLCVTGSHAVFGLLVALLSGSQPVTAEPALAFFACGAFAAIGALLGVRHSFGLSEAVRSKMDDGVELGVRGGLLGLRALFGAGALVFLVALLASLPKAGDLLTGTAPGFGGGIGLVLLSLAYLPNVLIGATAFVLGPGFSIGDVQGSPFGFTGGDVPGLPLLAALPESTASWWPLLLVIPVAVGALVGRHARRVPDLRTRLRAVSVAALVVGSGCLVLAALAGGTLGSAAFAQVGMPTGLLAVAGFGWTVMPGALVALPGAERRERVRLVPDDAREEAGEPEPADHPEPEQPDPEQPGPEEPDPEEPDPEEPEFPPDELGPPKGRTSAERDSAEHD